MAAKDLCRADSAEFLERFDVVSTIQINAYG